MGLAAIRRPSVTRLCALHLWNFEKEIGPGHYGAVCFSKFSDISCDCSAWTRLSDKNSKFFIKTRQQDRAVKERNYTITKFLLCNKKFLFLTILITFQDINNEYSMFHWKSETLCWWILQIGICYHVVLRFNEIFGFSSELFFILYQFCLVLGLFWSADYNKTTLNCENLSFLKWRFSMNIWNKFL